MPGRKATSKTDRDSGRATAPSLLTATSSDIPFVEREAVRETRIRRALRPAGQLLTWLFGALIVGLVAYPLLMLVIAPLSEFSAFWDQAVRIRRINQTLINTVALGIGSTILATVVATILAFSASQLQGKAAIVGSTIALIPLMVPPIAGVTGWVFMASPRVGYLNQALRSTPFFNHLETGPLNAFSLIWIVFITATYLVPYAFIFIWTGLRNTDPRLEDAARVNGSSWAGSQIRIMLPAIRPALVYGGGLVLLLSLGQFTAPLLLGRSVGIDVITTEMFRQTSLVPANYGLAAFLALPVAALAIAGVVYQRFLLRGHGRFASSMKGAGRVRETKPAAFIPIVTYGLFATVPPLFGLIVTAISPYWSGTILWDSFSLQHFSRLFDSPLAIRAIQNSLTFATGGTLAGIIISVSAALFIMRGHGALRLVIDYLVNLPVAVPAILLGMGIFLAYAVGPISYYGSRWLFIIAYVVILLPHGTRLALSGLAQMGSDLEAAGRVFGSTRAGAFLRITLPLLRRNLVSIALLMFVLMTQEFAASVLLATPGDQVMATQLYNFWESGIYPQVAAMALVIVGVAASGLLAISAMGRGAVKL